MGYLTTFTIYNDGVDMINPRQMTPEEKDKFLFKLYYGAICGLPEQRNGRMSVDVGFCGFANFMNIQYPRHADAHSVFVHYGNSVLDITPYFGDFEKLIETDINVLERYVACAEQIVKDAKRIIKYNKEKQ